MDRKTTLTAELLLGEIEMLLPIGMQWPLLEMLSFSRHISVASVFLWHLGSFPQFSLINDHYLDI